MTRAQNDLNTTSAFSGRDVRELLKDSHLALAQMEGASNQSWARGNGRFASLPWEMLTACLCSASWTSAPRLYRHCQLDSHAGGTIFAPWLPNQQGLSLNQASPRNRQFV